jgi:signal transduction histidine kinase
MNSRPAAFAPAATLARDQWVATVAHELRSPLNSIKSWTHVLDQHLHSEDDTVRRAVAGIMTGVEQQARLIDELLDLTHAMSGNLDLAIHPLALVPLLADTVESSRAAAGEKGLTLAADYPLGEAEIDGDRDRVQRIFANLLANAIESTPAGGTIEISLAREGAMARLRVRDDGIGIAPELIPHLLDPFRQAHPGGSNRHPGRLGLSLALVQRLAELHGGCATGESAGSGCGATFNVFLPLRRTGP